MPEKSEPWLTKTYTLTASECRHMFDVPDIAPDHSLSFSFMVLAVAVAISLALLSPYWNLNARQNQSGYSLCGLVVAGAALFWRTEGTTSVLKQHRQFERTYGAMLTEKTGIFDETGWTIQHPNCAEDRRSFNALQLYKETQDAVLLLTNVVHVLPKRIFSVEELHELRRLCRVPEPIPWRRWSVLTYALSSLEYWCWKRRIALLSLLIGPIVILPMCFVHTYTNPNNGSAVYAFFWWPLLGAAAIWYAVLLLIRILSALREGRYLYYGAIADSGFTVCLKQWEIFLPWPPAGEACESIFSFMFSMPFGGYHAFSKRVLTQAERELLQRRVAAIISRCVATTRPSC